MFPQFNIPTFLVVLGPLLRKGFLGLTTLSGFIGTTAWGSCTLNIKNILSYNTLIVLNMLVQ